MPARDSQSMVPVQTNELTSPANASRPPRRLARRAWLFGTGVAMGSLYATVADATQALAFDLDELVEHSDSIALVRAQSTKSQWTRWLGAKRIVTDTTLEIEQHWLGQALGAHTVVRTLGGEVGDLAQIVHSEAHFELGQSSLLFLRSYAQRFIPAALGLSQFPINAERTNLLRGDPRLRRLDQVPCRRALLGQPLIEVQRRLDGLWTQLGRSSR